MALRSNIFNITKVRNGVDANSRRITTNVETIYKFVQRSEYKVAVGLTEEEFNSNKTKYYYYDSQRKSYIQCTNQSIFNSSETYYIIIGTGENNRIIYSFSPNDLIIGILDTSTNQPLDIHTGTVVISLNGYNLQTLIENYYQNYFVLDSDNFHWRFYFEDFYNDLYTGDLVNLSQDTINLLYTFFESQEPTSIDFDIIFESSLLYRAIPLQIGTDLIAAHLFEKADGIYAAIADAGLVFDSNGLAINNGNLSITNSNNDTVFDFNKSDGTLSITGNITATSGIFHGTIEAEDGYFNRGTIGGFNITESSIESQTQKLQLFSQVSTDPGEIEQGSIDNITYDNIDVDDIVRTKNYIHVQSGHTYIIKTNLKKILIRGYEEENPNSHLQSTDWVDSGYSYTPPIITTEVGGQLQQDAVNFIRILLKEQDGTSITPEDVEFLTIIEDSSLINVENIHIGDGGVLDGYLRIGNLSLINPDKNYSSGDYGAVVMELMAPDSQGNDEVYFQLTTEGYIQGNNWSIGKRIDDDVVTARFGKLIAGDGEFSGTIYAKNGSFTGEIFSSVISASTINTTNFVTENTRSMGGSFIFKPTFEIISPFEDKGNNILEFTLSENSSDYFSTEDDIDFLSDQFEQGGIANKPYYGIPFDSPSRIRTKDFIKVNPNEIFQTQITSEKDIYWRGFVFYDQNKNPNYVLVSITSEDFVGHETDYYTYNDESHTYIQCESGDSFDSEKDYYTTFFPTTLRATVPEGSEYMKIVIAVDENQYEISPLDIESFVLKRVSDKVVAVSGFDTRFGKIVHVNENKIQIQFKNADYNILKDEDAFKNYNTLTLFGSAYYDTLIGINSDNTSAGDILSPRAFSMETFTDLQETPSEVGDIDYNLNLLLGDLSTLKGKLGTEFNYIDGYGLYADNVYLHGSLTTKNNNGTFAGVHTLKDIEFNYGQWSNNPDDGTYDNEKIVFWGGSSTLNEEGIQKSPFIVTDKGSIFANRGEFKGTVITNSLISNTVIQTPVIYGSSGNSNTPSLRIYDTNINDNTGGIGFYKKVGQIDKLTEELLYPENDDIITLRLSNTGFIHYYYNTSTQQNESTAFVRFSERGNIADAIYFNGTSYTAGTTTLSSREIKDTGSISAIITLVSGTQNQDNTTTPGYIQISYNRYGIKINDENGLNEVRLFGGKVVHDGETIFQSSGKQLDYKINRGYYCLFVS